MEGVVGFVEHTVVQLRSSEGERLQHGAHQVGLRRRRLHADEARGCRPVVVRGLEI